MKPWIVLLAALSFSGLVWADELDDAYTALKEAQAANKPDDIIKWAPEASKLARAEQSAAKPNSMSDADWKARLDYAKQVDTLSEYALSAAAVAPGADKAKVVAMVEELMTINPKSQYLGAATPAYLAALDPAKKMDGATKVITANPNNEDALFELANGNYGKNNDRSEQYSTRLINVMRTKAKPEGVSDADWDRKKNAMLGYGYYYAGVIAAAGARPSFPDCDRNLRGGLPYITKQAGLAGTTYFYLGLCNYQIGKLTGDKAKITEALQFTEQAAAIAGPSQGQAQTNAAAMRRELGLGAAPAKPAAAKAKGK